MKEHMFITWYREYLSKKHTHKNTLISLTTLNLKLWTNQSHYEKKKLNDKPQPEG